MEAKCGSVNDRHVVYELASVKITTTFDFSYKLPERTRESRRYLENNMIVLSFLSIFASLAMHRGVVVHPVCQILVPFDSSYQVIIFLTDLKKFGAIRFIATRLIVAESF